MHLSADWEEFMTSFLHCNAYLTFLLEVNRWCLFFPVLSEVFRFFSVRFNFPSSVDQSGAELL